MTTTNQRKRISQFEKISKKKKRRKDNSLEKRTKVKKKRALGGCLGTKRRRRT